ncbi:MAG: dipeptidase [Planctomycetaceae bacterium]|jgi:succinyl-diaminopimelate desuccinylase|nr:dipeptidase [Planctomycetaceae bacterium]
MKSVEEYIQSHVDEFRERLFEVLRFRSISADTSCGGEIAKTAQWLVDILKPLGLNTELIKTEGNPLIYAETPRIAGAPTLLIYGHYDVQPPDPLELWTTSPFEPTVRDNNIYARGSSDDKGQLLTHVFAIESLLKVGKPLPLQVKFLFEGEEEVGSASLSKYLHDSSSKKKLAADCIMVSDTCMFGVGQPTITYGLRGVMALELTVRGPSRDLHSGVFGGSVTNPAIALAKMITQVLDENGRIKVPGFYDDVLTISENEQSQLATLPFNEDEFYSKIGLQSGCGESGFSTLERRWCRPSFDVNGLTSGYQGEGSKTVIPSLASAKFSFRLVPNQSAEKIAAATKNFFDSIKPDGVTIELDYQHGAEAMAIDPAKSRFMKPATEALERTFGRPPVYTREGGSIPIVAEMANVLNAETLLIGWGQDDDNIHSPNEKFSLSAFQNGILASAHFIAATKALGSN